jgi:hypothetical protein
MEDRVLRAAFWTDAKVAQLGPQERLFFMWLWGVCDADGIAQLDQSAEVICTLAGWSLTALQSGRASELVDTMLNDLAQLGLAGQYVIDNRRWVWVPGLAAHQPRAGSLKAVRDTARTPPPQTVVMSVLTARLGRAPTPNECKTASPRSFGIKRHQSAPPPMGDVKVVWDCWRKRQSNPDALALTSSRSTIERGLKSASIDALCALIDYAYDSDEPGPRFWRGENDRGQTYLGIDNLFRNEKLASRVQMALEWRRSREHKKHTARPADDGAAQLDLGPSITKDERERIMKRWQDNLNASRSKRD